MTTLNTPVGVRRLMVHNHGETLYGSRLRDQDLITILWMRHEAIP